MYRIIRFTLLFTVFLLGYLAVFAQSVEGREDPVRPPVAVAVDVDSVVVYAERSPQRYVQVPITMTSVHLQQELPSGQDLRRLSNTIPNFYVPESGLRISAPVYVRGVGSTMGLPPVGLYVDGVPYFDRDAFLMELVDAARVEVLRGPQTTLYGRNSIIGQVNVATRALADSLGLDASVGYGSWQSWRAFLGVDLPFGPTRSRVTGYGAWSEGYLRNRYTGRLNAGSSVLLGRYRGEVRLPGEVLLQAGLTAIRTHDEGYGYHAVDSLRANPYWVNYSFPSSITRNRAMGYVRGVKRFDPAEVSATLAYTYSQAQMTMDADFTHFDIYDNTRDVRAHVATAELLVRSRGFAWGNWLVGAFGFWRNEDMHYRAHFGADKSMLLGRAGAILDAMDYYNKGMGHGASLFGQARWVERYTGLELTAGVRGEWEHTGVSYHEVLTVPSGYQQPWGKQDTARNYLRLLPRLSLLRSLGRWGSVYVTVAQGFKAGGYNALSNDPMGDAPQLQYDAESLWSYEVGAKTLVPRLHLRASLSLFLLDWKDQQIFVIERMGPAIRNAGDVRSYGVEGELSCQPLSWLLVGSAAGYSHARYVRHANPEVVGKQAVMAPEWTANVHVGGLWPLRVHPEVTLQATVSYAAFGRQYFDELNVLGQRYYGVLNGELGVTVGWVTVRGYVRNALGSRHFTHLFYSPVGKALPSYAHSGQIAAPRSWGVTVGVEL